MTLRLSFFAPLLAVATACFAAPAAAQQTVTIIEEEWIDGEWVVVSELVDERGAAPAARAVTSPLEQVETGAIAAFGPFRVMDSRTAAIVDITDSASPRHFAAMLSAYPEIAVLDFIEAPGTHDDIANFRIGRMLRAHGIATRAPAGGSVRSGAVELFLGGVTRTIDTESEFAVHGWLDDRGLGAEDYPAHSPEHRRYLDYYVEMGMDASAARAFYAMTNSVPFEDALWLTGTEMQGWMGVADASPAVAGLGSSSAPEALPLPAFPRLGYLDLASAIQ